MNKDWKGESYARLRANRKEILAYLASINATHVVVTYSGSGDSGGIDAVDVYRDDKKPDTKGTLRVRVASSSWNMKEQRWAEVVTKKDMPVTEALQEFVYDWIGIEHAGWENNDGASGECTIDARDGRFVLGHNSYYTESDYSEYSL